MSDPWKTVEHEGREVALWLDSEGKPVLEDPDASLEQHEIRDPRVKKLSDENARHRVKNKELEQRLEAQASTQERARQLAVDAAVARAFLAAGHPLRDAMAALELADLSNVKVEEDGSVVGADKAVAQTLERYPFLIDDTEPSTRVEPRFNDQPSGSPMNASRKKTQGLDRAALAKRFPSLRRGG